MGADLSYFDPHVPTWSVNGNVVPRSSNIIEALSNSDVAVLVQPHKEFLESANQISTSETVVLDTTGKFSGTNIERL
jgi:UDP-N-acetyl-D-mannosaminuronate dehydrogenase